MARNTITDGPGNWNLMLGLFDEHPANAHGLRSQAITLKCGFVLHVTLFGIERPQASSPGGINGPWKIKATPTNLPTGYYPQDNVLEISYHPYKHVGSVELELKCPECGDPILTFPEVTEEDVQGIKCKRCMAGILICDEGSKKWRWFDNESLRRAEQFHRPIMLRILEDPPAPDELPDRLDGRLA